LDKLNEFLMEARIVNGDRKGNEDKVRPRVWLTFWIELHKEFLALNMKKKRWLLISRCFLWVAGREWYKMRQFEV
jgi:hypothetical protein